jgi:hypothetical protein
MRELARHLVLDHGLRTLAYLGGHANSPDSCTGTSRFTRRSPLRGDFTDGPQWQGNYFGVGGAR